MRLLHAWKPDAETFDDENLVSAVGLVAVLALAEHTHLPDLLGERVRFDSEPIVSAAANPVGKIMSIIAGMLTGADSIADLQVIRSGGPADCSARCMPRRRWGCSCGSSPMDTPGNSPRS